LFDLSIDGIKKDVILLGLVQARLMPLFVLMPFMNRNLVPRTVAFAIAAGAGLIVVPTLSDDLAVRTDVSIIFVIIKEALLGLLLGFVCAIPFWAMEAVGTVIDNQRGASMAATINPLTGHDSSPIGMLLNIAFITFFFLVGGFGLLLDIVYESYRLWPPDRFWPRLDIDNAGILIGLVNRLALLAMLLASPALVIMFMAELGLALVSRFAPQLQVFFLAMPIKSALGIFVLLIYAATLFEFGADELRDLRNWTLRLDGILGGQAAR
jgi:type III secretion protein T